MSDLGNDVIDRPRHLLTASVGNHAKGAVLAAAFHDGDEGCRAVTGRLWQAIELLNLGKRDINNCAVPLVTCFEHLGQSMECLRAKDKVNVGCAVADGLALLASNTATHADHHLWALSFYRFPASQLMKDFFLRLFPNRARVQEKHVGFLGVVGSLHTMAFLE